MATKTLEYDNEVKLTIGEDKAFILSYADKEGNASNHVYGKGFEVISMAIATLISLFEEAKIDILKETILKTLVVAFKEADEDVKIYYKGEEVKE